MKNDKKKIICSNRKKNTYQIIDKLIAGMVLTGGEIKALRMGQLSSLENSYLQEKNGELYIVDLSISPYRFSNDFSKKKNDLKRDRKLLLNRREIERLIIQQKTKKCSLIPLEILLVGRWAKCEIALARKMKKFQIKQKKKEQQLEKEEKTNVYFSYRQ